VLGLAPLIRPDLALFGLLAAAGLVVLEARRGWRRIAGLAAVAAALPVGYEVFRAGSVRDPLTLERFWLNLAGAWERTQYRYPREPTHAADCRTA
jgi:hypothetical protein